MTLAKAFVRETGIVAGLHFRMNNLLKQEDHAETPEGVVIA
ncbi:hypothetical protein [Mesorhizobium sp.]|nr:hypothetical protein [Mesorhizobium sp.]